MGSQYIYGLFYYVCAIERNLHKDMSVVQDFLGNDPKHFRNIVSHKAKVKPIEVLSQC